MIAKLTKQELAKLSKIANYDFKNIDLITQAFIHASYFANLTIAKTSDTHYERLEFLGDRVLGLLIAQMLYELFPAANEGELSKRFNALVNTDRCAKVAQEIGLVKFVRASPDLKKTSTKAYHNIYADIMEAFIAALYLDGGFTVSQHFVYKYWKKLAFENQLIRSDAKTSLQEWAHKKLSAQPSYKVVNYEGPEHEPKYHIQVSIKGIEPAIGIGSSKRIAQIEAAKKILYRELVWKDD